MTSLIPLVSSNHDNMKRIGTGLAFVLVPLLFMFAFAVHPGLLDPRLLSEEELILRAHHNGLLAFGHVLVLLDVALLIVATLRFMRLLDHGSAAWAGLIGAALAVLGAVMLGAEKGAECLTMSALDTLPENQFGQMMPGLIAMFSKQGWMVLVWGVVLVAAGFAIQAIALLKTNAIPRWQSALFLISLFLIGAPDGLEIVNLSGSILMAVALVPYGIQTIIKNDP